MHKSQPGKIFYNLRLNLTTVGK